jgi:hypothetical protein
MPGGGARVRWRGQNVRHGADLPLRECGGGGQVVSKHSKSRPCAAAARTIPAGGSPATRSARQAFDEPTVADPRRWARHRCSGTVGPGRVRRVVGTWGEPGHGLLHQLAQRLARRDRRPAGLARPGLLDLQQVGNAATIVAVGTEMHVPRYGWEIAVAPAMQESTLRNLGHLGTTTTTHSACSNSAAARAGAPPSRSSTPDTPPGGSTSTWSRSTAGRPCR